MYLPVTHTCFGHSETTRLRKPCAASHQPGQSNLRSGCWRMNGWWIQMGLGVCQYSDFCSKHKFFLKSGSQNTVFAFEKSVWTVELMASQVNRGTFLFAPVQLKSPDRRPSRWWNKMNCHWRCGIYRVRSAVMIHREFLPADCWGRPMVSRYPGIPEQLSRMAHGWSDRHAGGGGTNIIQYLHLENIAWKRQRTMRSYQELSKKRIKRNTNLNRSWEQTSILCLVFGLCKALPSKYFRHLWLKLRWISGWAERTLETLAVCEFPCLAKRPIRATKKERNWGFLSVKFLCPILLACGELMCKSNIQSLRVSKAVDSKLSAKMIFGSLLLAGQLTEHLRRKSEQTLVAAADLRLSALFLEVFGWDMVATFLVCIDGYVSLWLQCNMNTCNECRRFTRVWYFFTSGGILHDKIADFFHEGRVFTQVILKHLSQASGELVTAVQRDALSVQAEEEALCKAEEEGTISDTALSLVHIWNLLKSFEILISCYFSELPSCALHDPIHSSVMFRILQTNSNSLS